MKNLALFLVLLSLIGVAYYFDQKQDVIDLSPRREKGEKKFLI
jgi:hypothetical protein